MRDFSFYERAAMTQIPCKHCGFFPKDHSSSLHCPTPEQIEGARSFDPRKFYTPSEVDVHVQTALILFGGRPDTITPDMRRIAKMCNYGVASYGR